MIARFNGTVDYVGADLIHATSGDFTYEVFVPAADIEFLGSKVGQRVTFYTLEYIEGNANFGQLAPRLIGFLRPEDKEFYTLFIGVKGIGPRKALRALSLPIGRIANAIALKDIRTLTSLPEIGKKTAEQILLELHGKVERFALTAGSAAPSSSAAPRASFQHQAIDALVKLGERRSEAESWVERVCLADPKLQDAQSVIQGVYRLKAVSK